jgi:nucleoside-diphosphate-sugar epimerase
MNILITGANGFIGMALCSRLAHDNKIVGVYHRKRPVSSASIVWGQADPPALRCEALRAGLTDLNSVAAICRKHSPDVVIHCAGIAHQKIGAVDSATYMQVNSEATENLANAAAKTHAKAQRR